MKMKLDELFEKYQPWEKVAFMLEKLSSLFTNFRAWGHTALGTPKDPQKERLPSL